MLKPIATIIFVAAFFCNPAFAADSPADRPASAESEATKLAEKKLQAVIPDIDLNNAPLTNAVDKLRDASGASIFVNWKRLETAGVRRDTPITLHLQGKRVSTILDLILAVADADKTKLGYAIDDGVIVISSADELKNAITRVYDIRQLLPAGAAAQTRVEAIEKLLTNQIDPPSWRDHGGSIGAIRLLQGQLIVTQTAENHERIAAMLKDLTALLTK
jgi:hypothetical protein